MKIRNLLICFVVLACYNYQVHSQEKSASEILEQAYTKAKAESKNVFVIFHASWCGWCKKMDKNMNDPLCKDLFNENYIIEHLTVKESANNKHLENPGAQDVLEQYHGDKSGIPFWLIFDSDGNLLTDSFNSSKQNLGCPASEEEVAVFIEKLKLTSKLTDEDLSIISEKFILKK